MLPNLTWQHPRRLPSGQAALCRAQRALMVLYTFLIVVVVVVVINNFHRSFHEESQEGKTDGRTEPPGEISTFEKVTEPPSQEATEEPVLSTGNVFKLPQCERFQVLWIQKPSAEHC